MRVAPAPAQTLPDMAALRQSPSAINFGAPEVPHSLTFAMPATAKPGTLCYIPVPGTPPDGGGEFKPLLVRLPAEAESGCTLTAAYQISKAGQTQATSEDIQCAMDDALWASQRLRTATSSCCSELAVVFGALVGSMLVCAVPFFFFPPLALLLLAVAPSITFATYSWYTWRSSVLVRQMMITMLESILYFVPLTVVLVIVQGPLGFADWLEPRCEEDLEDGPDIREVDNACLGKEAAKAFARAGLLEELLKYMCVRRLLWKPFVVHPRALLCYGGCAGLGFALLENTFYVLGGGLNVAVMRSVSTVPAHLLFGLIHGALLSRRRFFGAHGCFLVDVLPPTILHGFHNFLLQVAMRAHPLLGYLPLVAMEVSAWVALRMYILRLECVPHVNVHESIAVGSISGPRWCCCCARPCLPQWHGSSASSSPLPAPVSFGGFFEPFSPDTSSDSTFARGVGEGTLEITAPVTTAGGPVVLGGPTVTQGRWYLEAVLGPEARVAHVGWATPDGTTSWAAGRDGLWHGGTCSPWPAEMTAVGTNFVLGCALDVGAGTASFTINGLQTSSGFTGIPAGVLPALTLSGTLIVVVSGRFAYEPPEGHSAIAEAVTPWDDEGVSGVLVEDKVPAKFGEESTCGKSALVCDEEPRHSLKGVSSLSCGDSANLPHEEALPALPSSSR